MLSEIGEALGSAGEVVVVPGNHDHHLLTAWFERRARDGAAMAALSSDTAVTWQPGDPLATVAEALRPAKARVSYPGVWLREDVYATHGHYGDRHTTVPMLERLAAGAMARIVSQGETGPRCIEDYEAVLAPVYAWIHAVAQSAGTDGRSRGSRGASARVWRELAGPGSSHGIRQWRRRGLAAAFPALVWSLSRAGLGPLRPQLSPGELRRASLRAQVEVLVRLQIDARHVIFGHTHRAGPLPADVREEWSATGEQQLMNTGSWVLEPTFVGSRPEQSPYRVGFCARVVAGESPVLTNLLDAQAPWGPG